MSATYDDQDRLLTYGTYEFTYTANGVLETKTDTANGDAWLFQYDALGNLVSVGLPNGDLVEYLVDGMGRRVGKKKNGVLLKQWIYRDALKPVAELDGSGNLVSEFVYGTTAIVPDYVVRAGTVYRVLSDHLGSPRLAMNVANSADVPFAAGYTSFGEQTGTGLEWMPFGFAGGLYDPESGLIRFGARDLDSSTGRWTAKDPARFNGRQGNFYVYVGNDPVNRSDPFGLAGPWDVFECAFAVITCGLTCASPVTRPECGFCGADVARECGDLSPRSPLKPPSEPRRSPCEDLTFPRLTDDEYQDEFGCTPQRSCNLPDTSPCDPSAASCF